MSLQEELTTDSFAYLYRHPFINFTTFRKDGTAVPTTVWFANEGGKLFITTQKGAGKVKRIRNNPRVTLTPSDRMGQVVEATTVQGNAHEIIDAEGRVQARALLRQKYGVQFDQIAGEETEKTTYIVVEPVL
ncbi:PPOX class F420-dependent oxidoreductase [Tengunoibacter tsumagoiensis]|uniref:PPOX class F420-dependent oxidoreductase n=1 Tax=Tengunoibacter tsumagoiensis TaxID=2014871 RepID=A0A402A9V3_9CHLR|nr:PPOX class F420-dependent oxidoreductase [Tengunoibacter tsumagoiensis]GCE15920.1 PPOX class F420-dependent oxidoreductase [Tengunoibacter tsumagoiensis]